jgi:hypothetical protein
MMTNRIRKKIIVTMRLQVIFNIKKSKTLTPEDEKANSFVDHGLGSLVYQLPRGVTLAYDLLFGAHDSSLERYHQGD